MARRGTMERGEEGQPIGTAVGVISKGAGACCQEGTMALSRWQGWVLEGPSPARHAKDTRSYH